MRIERTELQCSAMLMREIAHLKCTLLNPRDKSLVLSCHCSKYGSVSTSGNTRTLTVITLGGDGYTWEDQCNIESYKNITNLETQPFCNSVNSTESLAPYRSSVIMTFTAPALQASSANSLSLVAAAGALFVGAAALLMFYENLE
jgi:hypothetical protein